MTTVFRVAATPDAGYWMSANGPDILLDAVNAAGGNLSIPCNYIGMDPKLVWMGDGFEDLFPVTGYFAEMLLEVLKKMGPSFDCVVDMLPTYTAALYATSRAEIAHLGWSPFSPTVNRNNCAPEDIESSGATACPPFDPSLPLLSAVSNDACCASFTSYPLTVAEWSSATLYSTNKLSSEQELQLKVIIEMINIVMWIVLVTIVIGNALWLIEKSNPSQNEFSRAYIDGAFEAIWAVSNGFSGVRTPCGRVLGLLFQFANLALFALLAGTMASVLSTSSVQVDTYRWNSIEDVPHDATVCMPSPVYAHIDHASDLTNYYVPEDNQISTCVADLLSGKCDLVFGGSVTLWSGLLAANQTLADLLQLIPMGGRAIASPAFPRNSSASNYDLEIQYLVDQSLVAADSFREKWYSEFFSFTRSSDEEVQDSEVGVFDAIEWPALVTVAAYTFVMFAAHMAANAKRGRQCVVCRLVIILRNTCREGRLRDKLGADFEFGIEHLTPDMRGVFQLVDCDESGTIDASELTKIGDALTKRYNTLGSFVSTEDAAQIKQMLVDILHANVDGQVTPRMFADAYAAQIYTVDAAQLLWELAVEARRMQAATRRSQTHVSVGVKDDANEVRLRRKAISIGTRADTPRAKTPSAIELVECNGVSPRSDSALTVVGKAGDDTCDSGRNHCPDSNMAQTATVVNVEPDGGVADSDANAENVRGAESTSAEVLRKCFARVRSDIKWRQERMDRKDIAQVVDMFATLTELPTGKCERMKARFYELFRTQSSDDDAVRACVRAQAAPVARARRSSVSL